MDEAELHLALGLTQQPVIVAQPVQEELHSLEKRRFRVVVVVQVDLDIARARVNRLRDPIEQMRTVLLFGIEVRVLRLGAH